MTGRLHQQREDRARHRAHPAGGIGPFARVVVVVLLLLMGGACASGPAFQGMEGDEIYQFGVQAFEEGDWDDAIQAFQRILSAHPGHPRIAEARMYLARAHFENEEYITAANEFELFLQRHPAHGSAPEASLGVCRSYAELAPIPQRDQTYTRRAQDRCRQTATEFQGLNVAEPADSIRREMTDRLAEKWYLEARQYQRRGGHAPAVLVFQDIVDYYPQTRWAPQAFLGLYRSYEAMGWEEEMDQVAERLLFLYPDSEAAREVSRERADDGAGLGREP